MVISFIGAGNVAIRMSLAMQEKGFDIGGIYSRNPEHRDRLVRALVKNGAETLPADAPEDLFGADVVILAVSDDAIPETVASLAEVAERTAGKPVFVHTSGATSIDVFAPLHEKGFRCGVLYPLMTLNKAKNVDFKDVPLLIEASDSETGALLDGIASDLGSEHYFYSSEERLKMHVAAVFTCNFVNYILGLAFPIVQRDHPLLIPSTIEAVRNAFLKTPAETLTGPARRNDMETVRKHLELLEKLGMDEQVEFYKLFTKKILEKYA